ncbi:porin family protein [Sphingomonas parva]|uniref:Porin family protein n=1 Tax=Sphingomonas parva TaxID=2555898 RepID=A0A4Y8ZSP0_9SPHN|nr:porin family protein [Sphingomonas parva]TFI58934.1 porin family protein [Sphingomonas parva]
MKKYVFIMLAGSAVLVATPAAAEGFRAEVHGGWDHASADGDGESGITYGIGLGYDLPVGEKMTVGLDLSADLNTMEECETSVVVANDRACLDAGRDLAAAVRLGYKVSDKGTLYALAGYTNARFRFAYTTPAGVTTSDGENLDGFRLGAGYQHAIGEKVYGKVEYRYSNYENDVTRHQVLLGVGVNF